MVDCGSPDQSKHSRNAPPQSSDCGRRAQGCVIQSAHHREVQMSTDILGSKFRDNPASSLSGRRGYGSNGNSFPSSIKTTERTDTPPLAQRPDATLDAVATHGSRTVKPTTPATLSD